MVRTGSDALAMTGRDTRATWVPLDQACRAPGCSEGWIEDEIENRRLPFRGYIRGEGDVTTESPPPSGRALLEPDWTIAMLYGAACKLSLMWLNREPAMVEGVQVPADDASPSVRRWRKRPPVAVLKAAALAVAETYKPDDEL